MSRSLLVVYSNLGLGGIPIQIRDIANEMARIHPQTPIHIVIKERRLYDIRSSICNPLVTFSNFYDHFNFDSKFLFMLWVWYRIYVVQPSTILSFISPYALTVLATKVIIFWRNPVIIINEAHFTSTMLSTMAFPTLQKVGIQLLYPFATRIITPTKAVYDHLHEVFNISKDRMICISNWSRYANTKLSTTTRPYDLIYSGRIEKTKRILEIIKTCERIIRSSRSSLRCIIVGDGADKDTCVEYIRDHNLQDHIFLKEPTINISRYMSRAKICVFNPAKDTEGFPILLLDAISLGTLVVTTDFTGLRETFNNSNSIIGQTSADLQSKIIFSLSHYKQLTKQIRNAKIMAKSLYSMKNVLKYIRTFDL